MAAKPQFNALYARYYDVMYAGKAYSKEAAFFDDIIKRFGPRDAKTLLSLGAGTLNHEEHLAKKGYIIDGYDISPAMVSVAKKKIKDRAIKNVTVAVGDMLTLKPKRHYDAVLAMFNVVSYCANIRDIERVIKNAAAALAPDGVLVFDCWNGDIMHKDPPHNTWTKTEAGKTTFYKLVTASEVKNDGFVRTAELLAFTGKKAERYTETHKLHGWRIPDLQAILLKHGLRLEMVSEFMRFVPYEGNRWSMVVIATK